MAGQGSKGGGQVQPVTALSQPKPNGLQNFLGVTPPPIDPDGTYTRVLTGVTDMPQLGTGGAQVTPAAMTAKPMQPQPGFNVNQAASTGLQGALGATQAAVAAPLNVGAYMNPYTQQVIDTTQADIERQRQMAINNMGAAATRANAFGGSRQGVAEGVTNAEFGRVAGNLIAPMRRDAFNTAMSNAMTDRSQRLNAANQLGGLANQAFTTGRTINQDMMQQGLMQRALQQSLIDAARQDFAGYSGSPMQSLSPTIAALGAAPVPQSSTTRQNPGILGILGGLLPFF